MPAPRHILGISAYYHDAAAALLSDETIVAAAQEERFTRKKGDASFPAQAIQFCLKAAGLSPDQIDTVAFYDKPILKFSRLLETYLAVAPRGWRTFPVVLSDWLGEKLDLRKTIRNELPGLRPDCPILFAEHHQSHAASAFYPSPFSEAAILTIDGVGEWATTTIGVGKNDQITLLRELRFPHSLGLLYSASTVYCGFRINSGEYKLMGLAPYGEPVYRDQIFKHLLEIKPDGSFRLNLDYFDFLGGTRMFNSRFERLFCGPARAPEASIDRRYMDVARSIQAVTEEVVVRLARHAREITGQSNLCLAGGVTLNCVANGRILREKIFERVWIQPAAGDAGGALGAALLVWHGPRKDGRGGVEVRSLPNGDRMQGTLLGPAYTDAEIAQTLDGHNAVYRRLKSDALLDLTVDLLRNEKVVGWFQGRMEFGPRALGNRSILGDARSPRMQTVMNLKVKFRESFRPFAPVVRRERVADYFDLQMDSPYMLFTALIRPELRCDTPAGIHGLDLLKETRSSLPAITHVDYSARVQTLAKEDNPLFYELLARFEKGTGCGVLVNTSFNVRGEPIVCTPDDAYRCFVKTEMDYLVIGSFLLERAVQPPTACGVTGPAEPIETVKPTLQEDPKQWRKSALVTVLGLAMLSSLLCWRQILPVHRWQIILACLGAGALAACLKPRWFRRSYRFSTRAGWWLNRVLSRILLGLIFFFILTPLGLLLRLFGKDLLRLKRPHETETYWCESRKDTSLDRLF